jgi:hypothetical protein
MNFKKIYTGEGFKNEKLLAVMAAAFTIVSSILLIQLSMLQKRHLKMQIDQIENGKKNE